MTWDELTYHQQDKLLREASYLIERGYIPNRYISEEALAKEIFYKRSINRDS